MPTFSNSKNRITLSDYDFQRDIENRLLMSHLSVFEVKVLQEIVDGSLKTTLKNLTDALDSEESLIDPILDKFQAVRLVHCNGNNVSVDKEMRKYYESQLMKFDKNFKPNIEFLQGLLSKIPIHILPEWYAIPKGSDNIFNSIIENYLLTPKIYQRYLKELYFEDPYLNHIMEDVFSSPDLKLEGKTVIEKYNLSRVQFEEYMLHLEYNFVCCLGYHQSGDEWIEVVTPFSEWKDYLTFLKKVKPTTIENLSKITKLHPQDFGFTLDLCDVLEKCREAKSLEKKFIANMFSASVSIENYSDSLIKMAQDLHLAEYRQNSLHWIPVANDWLKKPLHDQAHIIHRQAIDDLLESNENFLTEREIRKIERSLKRVANDGWILLDDFMKGFTTSLGKTEGATLTCKGKRWQYAIPSYTAAEKQQIKNVIFGPLFKAGIVSIGTYEGAPCFCITPFGKVTLFG